MCQVHRICMLASDPLAKYLWCCCLPPPPFAPRPNLQISNYALPGHECRHNKAYWHGRQYYAFGLGAASYLAGVRYSRPAKMAAYAAWVDALPAEPVHVAGSEMPSESQVGIVAQRAV